jgi:hypothetical protein
VDEGADIARHDPHLDVAAAQELIELAVALAVEEALRPGGHLVPTGFERLLTGRLGDFDVVRIELAVTDDLDLTDGFQIFVDDLEDGAAEISRDAAVATRALELLAQEHLG